MSGFFSKLIDDLTAEDVAALKDQPESQIFEIKPDFNSVFLKIVSAQ
jgi:hypothetical protein